MSRHRLLLLAALAVAPLAACETTYIIDGQVTVDDQLAPAAPSNMILLVAESAAEIPDWSARDPSAERADAEAYAPATRAYAYRYEQFGSSPHAIYLAAFVDTDGDGNLGSGEPYGEYAGNPVLDAPYGITAAATVADIAIDQIAP